MKIDPALIRKQLLAATAKGQVVMADRPPEPAPDKPKPKRQSFDVQEELDWDVLTSWLGVEVNSEISTLRLRGLLSARINQMKAEGTYAGLPQVVREMLVGLSIATFETKPTALHFDYECTDGRFIISGSVKDALDRKAVQVLIHWCEWRLDRGKLILFGGFISQFDESSLKRIWENAARSFPD